MNYRKRKLIVLESNIDDMNPEWFEYVSERLFKAGALDVTLIPVSMKKNRPAVLLQVLMEPKKEREALGIIFEETTTLGIRSHFVTRYELRREVGQVKTPYGIVRVKIGKGPQGEILNVAPEYQSCLEVARRKKVPLKKIYTSVIGGASPRPSFNSDTAIRGTAHSSSHDRPSAPGPKNSSPSANGHRE